MGNNLYGNGNGHYSHGNQFSSADTVLSFCNSAVSCKLVIVIGYYGTQQCDFLRKSKTKTYNIPSTIFLVSVL